uniref:Uncharacterized protein n=1 Tax=Timema poppense TaxID=170557 RepID=A0A7R9DT23_TIMPO|nr:unnamed protein product [Timema poppensis]
MKNKTLLLHRNGIRTLWTNKDVLETTEFQQFPIHGNKMIYKTLDIERTWRTLLGSPVFWDSCFKSLASGLWFIAKYDFMVRSWWCLKDVRMRLVLCPFDPGIPGVPGPERPKEETRTVNVRDEESGGHGSEVCEEHVTCHEEYMR